MSPSLFLRHTQILRFKMKLRVSTGISKRLKSVLFQRGGIWGTLFLKCVILNFHLKYLSFENMIANTLNSGRGLNFDPTWMNFGLKSEFKDSQKVVVTSLVSIKRTLKPPRSLTDEYGFRKWNDNLYMASKWYHLPSSFHW